MNRKGTYFLAIKLTEKLKPMILLNFLIDLYIFMKFCKQEVTYKINIIFV